MTDPSGLPAWTRTAGIADYGGHALKENYGSQGVVNPRTDVGAAAIMRAADHIAACVRTAAFAVINYTSDDTTPADPVVHSVQLMTGVDLDGYTDGGSPPSGMPTLTRNGDGDVTVTFSASYLDAYGVSADFAIRGAKATVNDTASRTVPVELVSATVCRVRAFTSSTGAAIADKRVTLTVY